MAAKQITGLRCVECGATDDSRRGWTLRLDVDGDLAAFCPDCDDCEFGTKEGD